MRRLHALIATLIFTTCFLGFQPADAQESPNGAVLQANADFYAALNAMFVGDVDPMIQVWSHASDVSYLGPDDSFVVGWENVLKQWQAHAGFKLNGEVTASDEYVVAGETLAVVINREVGFIQPNDKKIPVDARATNTFRLEAGEWKMIGHHTDLIPIQPKPGASSANEN